MLPHLPRLRVVGGTAGPPPPPPLARPSVMTARREVGACGSRRITGPPAPAPDGSAAYKPPVAPQLEEWVLEGALVLLPGAPAGAAPGPDQPRPEPLPEIRRCAEPPPPATPPTTTTAPPFKSAVPPLPLSAGERGGRACGPPRPTPTPNPSTPKPSSGSRDLTRPADNSLCSEKQRVELSGARRNARSDVLCCVVLWCKAGKRSARKVRDAAHYKGPQLRLSSCSHASHTVSPCSPVTCLHHVEPSRPKRHASVCVAYPHHHPALMTSDT
jgi:hypothetical protein